MLPAGSSSLSSRSTTRLSAAISPSEDCTEPTSAVPLRSASKIGWPDTSPSSSTRLNRRPYRSCRPSRQSASVLQPSGAPSTSVPLSRRRSETSARFSSSASVFDTASAVWSVASDGRVTPSGWCASSWSSTCAVCSTSPLGGRRPVRDRHPGPQVVGDRREVVGHHVEVAALQRRHVRGAGAGVELHGHVEAGLAQRLPVHPGDDLLLGGQAGADGDLGLRLGGRLRRRPCSRPAAARPGPPATRTSPALDHPLRGRARIPSATEGPAGDRCRRGDQPTTRAARRAPA